MLHLVLHRARQATEHVGVEAIDHLADVDDRRLVLVALQAVSEAEAVLRYLRSIILERGDYNGRVLTIRRDDLRAICSLLRTDETTTLERLTAWGALVDGQSSTGS